MDRPRIFRLLRIAVSAVCLVVCAASIALWVRSYWWTDGISGTALPTVTCGMLNFPGQIVLIWSENPPFPSKWTTYGGAIGRGDPPFKKHLNKFGLGVMHSPVEHLVILPHWIPVAISAAFAILPWLDYRFSLRTLLLAMTLSALVLGLVMALR